MIRTFNAVGQGAFYTEKSGNGFTTVYDCGGQNKKFVEEKIKKTFLKDGKIGILFISHFHSDHINGVEFLLTHCNIDKVVLLFLHENIGFITVKYILLDLLEVRKKLLLVFGYRQNEFSYSINNNLSDI